MRTIFALLLLSAALHANPQTHTFDFATGYAGWSGDFADYPVSDSLSFGLAFRRAPLPAPLDTTLYGLRISGTNHSDDLFMFIRRKISGLLPHTAYRVVISVDFASDAPTNAVGAGGPPAEAVDMKAGVTLVKPTKVNVAGFYQLNIRKGYQSQPGPDMDTIGHIGVSDTTTVFTLIGRSNASAPFPITTDATGEVWICIGTESGFMGTTTLYYQRVEVSFSALTSSRGTPQSPGHIVIYPNPARNVLHIRAGDGITERGFRIYDRLGRLSLAGRVGGEPARIDIEGLPTGIYYLVLEGGSRPTLRFIVE